MINGLRSSNITLSSTFCYRFQQMVHFPFHFLLFVPVSGLKSLTVRIQLVYNNRWISGFSISGPCETRWKLFPADGLWYYTLKYRILLNTLENSSPSCNVAVKSHGNSSGLRSNQIFGFFYWSPQISSPWALGVLQFFSVYSKLTGFRSCLAMFWWQK